MAGKYMELTAKEVDALEVMIGKRSARYLGMCDACAKLWDSAGLSKSARVPITVQVLLNTFDPGAVEDFAYEMFDKIGNKGISAGSFHREYMSADMSDLVASRWTMAFLFKWETIKKMKDLDPYPF